MKYPELAMKSEYSIQPFHSFLCNSQNYHPRGAVDDLMNSASGHSQHRGGDSFDCCTERNEIVVLLPNSKLTKGNNKWDADAHTVCYGGSGSLNFQSLCCLWSET